MFLNISTWMLWVLSVGIALYWYLTKKHSHWKNAGVPYLPAKPIVGSIGNIFRKSFHEIELDNYIAKGRIYGMYEGRRPTLVIGDPDVLRDIMIKDFHFFTDRRDLSTGRDDDVAQHMLQLLNGERWKRVRTIVTPTFTTGKIKKMTSILIDSAKTLSNNFKKAAEEEKPIDTKGFFGAFAMDVIASCAFGTKLDSHNDPKNPFVSIASSIFNRNITCRMLLFFLFPDLTKYFGITPFPPGPFKFFRSVTLKMVKERRQSGKRRNDFLQLMMDAETELEQEEHITEKDAVSEMTHEENNEQIWKPGRILRSLSHDEMVAQCVTFFFAGYDSIASTLAMVVYELALNSDVQERLIAEIDEAIREKGELTYETVYEMKYLDCVVAETLRKYPPAIRSERVAKEDYVVQNHNITITKGMIVGIPIYAMHHDPEYYPNPEKFDPERFTPEMKACRHPFMYLPFGAGPRNCVAMRFALMEIKVCVAYILSQFRFHTCSQTAVPMQFYFGQGLLTPKEVILKVVSRNDSMRLLI